MTLIFISLSRSHCKTSTQSNHRGISFRYSHPLIKSHPSIPKNFSPIKSPQPEFELHERMWEKDDEKSKRQIYKERGDSLSENINLMYSLLTFEVCIILLYTKCIKLKPPEHFKIRDQIFKAS